MKGAAKVRSATQMDVEKQTRDGEEMGSRNTEREVAEKSYQDSLIEAIRRILNQAKRKITHGQHLELD